MARICCNGPQWIPKSPEQVLNIPPDGLLYLDGINVAANAVSPNARVPYVHSWSTSVAYQLPWRMAVEVSYLGSKGSHLFLPPISLNPVPFALSEAYLGQGLNPLTDVTDPLGRRDANGNVIAFSQGYLGAKYLGFENFDVMLDASGGTSRSSHGAHSRRTRMR